MKGIPAMKFAMITAALALSLVGAIAAPPARAAGCLSGAAVGGVAGHVAGHHALLGAAAGCAVGHHMANKAQQQKAVQNQAPSGNGNPQP
jgi:hypothetical protein